MKSPRRPQGPENPPSRPQDSMLELLVAFGPDSPPSENDIVDIILNQKSAVSAGRRRAVRCPRP